MKSLLTPQIVQNEPHKLEENDCPQKELSADPQYVGVPPQHSSGRQPHTTTNPTVTAAGRDGSLAPQKEVQFHVPTRRIDQGHPPKQADMLWGGGSERVNGPHCAFLFRQ